MANLTFQGKRLLMPGGGILDFPVTPPTPPDERKVSFPLSKRRLSELNVLPDVKIEIES